MQNTQTGQKNKSRKRRILLAAAIAAGLMALVLIAVLVVRLFFREDPEKLQREWVEQAREEGVLGNADGYEGATGHIDTPEGGKDGDRDGDGIPDQEDILRSAGEYVKTKPSYESRYYAGGYPDDGYGVCADVVAFALLRAGYDLQKLVDMDVRWYPSEYPRVDQPDPNIDFRRVANLQVYFTHTAESLTTDPDDTDAWQGGDIVTFPGHIGIVSDKVNARGVHYVIHHAYPGQISYEEDILHDWEITGHFRLR